MSEKDILMQIEADLQSGNDVVQWGATRVMNEAERKIEHRFWRNTFLKKFFLPSVVVAVLYALLSVYLDLTFGAKSWLFILCTLTLVHIGCYWFVRRDLSSKSHTLIYVNIDFKKEVLYEHRLLSGRKRHKFRQQEQTLKLLPELPEDQSPETAALRQRVQTLLHEKTGLHFE